MGREWSRICGSRVVVASGVANVSRERESRVGVAKMCCKRESLVGVAKMCRKRESRVGVAKIKKIGGVCKWDPEGSN